jgi:uncharacterized membrane protein (DUF4010 family)
MISVLRVLVIVTIVKPEVGLVLAAPALVAAIVFGGLGVAFVRRGMGDSAEETKLGNPFDLLPLLAFAASFAIVAGAGAALTDLYGASGVILTSGISGILDVDVASLSAARLAGGRVPIETAAAAVLAAIAANGAARVVIAAGVGPLRFSLPYFVVSLVAFAAGAAAFFLLRG